MKHDNDTAQNGLQAVFDYHQATKHRFDAYARGPGRLDWATQPDPFRRYVGAELIPLQKVRPGDQPCYDAVFNPDSMRSPVPVSARSIAQLFYDSLALSAWKSTGGTRWALRVNASSGNLHPTEGYLLCGPVEKLCDTPMVGHYAPKEHALEVRATFDTDRWKALSAAFPASTFFVGLSSVYWREAWKYGQRAFRYCNHDAGHALAAVSIAAAGLGWRTRLLDDLGGDDLSLLMGTFCAHDAEREEPDMLIACMPHQKGTHETSLSAETVESFAALDWRGTPNHLSPSHIDWGMEGIAQKVRRPRGPIDYARLDTPPEPWSLETRAMSLRRVIRQRRSAVDMDGHTRIPRDTFYRMLYRTLALPGAVPFSTLPWKPHIHLTLFVHRVEDIPQGLYLLLRDPAQKQKLQAALTQADPWKKPPGCPDALPLYLLIEADTRAAARQ
ncbi:MAG: SagB/ThcOx family dehydrogenase, partial [Pseudomonadota bacterium]